MRDFSCESADKALCQVIADRIRYYKEPEGGRRNMCRAMEELICGERQDKAVDVAKTTLSEGELSPEKVVFRASLEEVKFLANNQPA